MRAVGSYLAAFGLVAALFMPVYAGYENKDVYDPGTSDSKSGVTTPREYFLPKTPAYDQADMNEFSDYRRTAYSPYALLQLLQPLKVGEITFKPGYYHVKVDIVPVLVTAGAGPGTTSVSTQVTSSATAVKTGEEAQPDSDKARRTLWKRLFGDPNKTPDYARRKDFPTVDPAQAQGQRSRVSLMLKKEGEIEVVIPVGSSSVKDRRLKGGPNALLLVEPGDPLHPQVVYLQYCVRQICYKSVPLQPGLVQ